jgi:[acyl-carrier-protein] S-malonyltransferase
MSTNESERHGVAFIFPGQGAQAVGMGADLYESSQAARSVFKKVDEALGRKLSKVLFEGPEEELRETKKMLNPGYLP